jgi:hypothetical protein
MLAQLHRHPYVKLSKNGKHTYYKNQLAPLSKRAMEYLLLKSRTPYINMYTLFVNYDRLFEL